MNVLVRGPTGDIALMTVDANTVQMTAYDTMHADIP